MIGDKEFYEKKWKNEFFALDVFSPAFFHRKRLIKRIIKNKHLNGKILDIGCGDGSLLIQFQGNENELHGWDISEKAIQLAKSKFGDIGYFATGSITDYGSLPKGNFDVIICSEVLEHIDNDELAIKNLYNKLKIGGHLIITVPHRKKYWAVHDELSGHVRRYEKDELENKIKKNGFIIRQSFGWGYPLLHLYVFLKNSRKQNIQNISKGPKFKEFLSAAVRLILYFDDLFIYSKRGRTLFLLAKKSTINEYATE